MPAFVKRHFVAVRFVLACLALLWAAAAFADSPVITTAQTAQQQTQPIQQTQQPQQQQNGGRQNDDLQLYRLESVERRMESAERSAERLLIAAIVLAMLMLAVLFTGAWRAYIRWQSERLNATARNARQLMRDIKTELERPQLSYLRTGYELRRIMRRMRKGVRPAGDDERMLAECGTNGDMPASLYLAARALLAEASGQWHLAAKWLDGAAASGMKDDIDVLLHLAHVHSKLAAAAEDKTARGEHLLKSREYYAKFAVVLPADYRDMPMPPKPTIPARQDKAANALMTKAQQPPQTRTMETPPLPKAQTPPQTPQVSQASQEKSAELSPPKVQPSPQKPIAAQPPLPKVQTAESPSLPQGQTAAPSLSKPQPAESSLPKTQTPPQKPEAEKPPLPKAEKVEQSPPLPKEEKKAEKVAPSSSPEGEKEREKVAPPNYERAPLVWFANAEQIAEADREQPQDAIKKAAANIRYAAKDGYANLLTSLRGSPLPLIPLVPISPPPANIHGAQKMMWEEIVNGNRRMYRAALALSLGARNRHIDAAIGHYARAQSHYNNDYLCHNAALANIAKALHLPENKRRTHFDKAAQMLLSGNAARRHYFDFSLAVLYALADNGEQCRKFLQQCAPDKDALAGAEFDKMRGYQWFAEFAE